MVCVVRSANADYPAGYHRAAEAMRATPQSIALDFRSVLRFISNCGTTTSPTANGSSSRRLGRNGRFQIAERADRHHSLTSGSPTRPDAPFLLSAACPRSPRQSAHPPAGWRQPCLERQASHGGAGDGASLNGNTKRRESAYFTMTRNGSRAAPWPTPRGHARWLVHENGLGCRQVLIRTNIP